MSHLSVRYILFSCVGSTGDEDSECVAALVLRPLENGDRLSVYQRLGWERKCQGEYLQLARAILEDWDRVDSSEACAVFQDLQDASLGPLRASKAGVCPEDELKIILSQELEISS